MSDKLNELRAHYESSAYDIGNIDLVADKALDYCAELELEVQRLREIHESRYSKFDLGDLTTKIKGSEWQGRIVGHYSTVLTPEGYAVESSSHAGSVQIYPAAALELLQRD